MTFGLGKYCPALEGMERGRKWNLEIPEPRWATTVGSKICRLGRKNGGTGDVTGEAEKVGTGAEITIRCNGCNLNPKGIILDPFLVEL